LLRLAAQESVYKGDAVTEPFVFVSTYQANPETLDEYKNFLQRTVDLVEENEPEMIYFNFFLNEETNEVTTLQVHRSVENMAVHMGVIAPLLAESRDKEYFDNSTLKVRILGTPTAAIREQMEQMAGAGVTVTINEAVTEGHLNATAT
jgi:hypothetical protein